MIKSPLWPLLAAGLIFGAGVFLGGTWELSGPIAALRAVRMTAALVVGGALALSGMTFQAVLRNPLAEPFTLGISGGASVGAVLVFMLGWRSFGVYCLPGGAFLGAVTVLAAVLAIGRRGGRGSESLLLSGVIAGTVASSVLMYLLSAANNDELAAATWWMLGDLQSVDDRLLLVAAVITGAVLLLLRWFAGELDALSLGDDEAFFLGVNPRRMRLFFVAAAALLAAETVALAGIIGFCGLVVPHAVRRLYGSSHRKIVLAVFGWGAGFLMLCDLLSRVVSPGREIPIGVLTSCVGGPLFLYLLNRRGRR